EGITRLAVDSIFMMPHLGVLAEINPTAATEVFNKDCMIMLGSCVAPVGKIKPDAVALSAEIHLPDGTVFKEDIRFGEMRLLPCGLGQKAKAILKPGKGLDLGAGKNETREVELPGGVVGIVLDTRGRRPFVLPSDNSRIPLLKKWMKELKAYPEHILS
ncbi:MAG TPA: methylaspartate mutase, partial [Candidatus Cloacimonadota bacterium]|nr:methylaspartate mutase [Candidatus Cloacimonadota bacterium]